MTLGDAVPATVKCERGRPNAQGMVEDPRRLAHLRADPVLTRPGNGPWNGTLKKTNSLVISMWCLRAES